MEVTSFFISCHKSVSAFFISGINALTLLSTLLLSTFTIFGLFLLITVNCFSRAFGLNSSRWFFLMQLPSLLSSILKTTKKLLGRDIGILIKVKWEWKSSLNINRLILIYRLERRKGLWYYRILAEKGGYHFYFFLWKNFVAFYFF